MKDVTYSSGTIFRTYVSDSRDALEASAAMVYSMLVQVDKNKFQLISLASGNRWLSKKTKGDGTGSVTRKALGELVTRIDIVDSIEPIGHCAEIDYDRLLGVYDTEGPSSVHAYEGTRAQAQAKASKNKR